ncbi:hypothetical protein B0H11DRAFT_2420674 [Mycena galericulata]|nr:hypothetical protein B0H11DRAFT_2420674 [Mycena galericulata]
MLHSYHLHLHSPQNEDIRPEHGEQLKDDLELEVHPINRERCAMFEFEANVLALALPSGSSTRDARALHASPPSVKATYDEFALFPAHLHLTHQRDICTQARAQAPAQVLWPQLCPPHSPPASTPRHVRGGVQRLRKMWEIACSGLLVWAPAPFDFGSVRPAYTPLNTMPSFMSNLSHALPVHTSFNATPTSTSSSTFSNAPPYSTSTFSSAPRATSTSSFSNMPPTRSPLNSIPTSTSTSSAPDSTSTFSNTPPTRSSPPRAASLDLNPQQHPACSTTSAVHRVAPAMQRPQGTPARTSEEEGTSEGQRRRWAEGGWGDDRHGRGERARGSGGRWRPRGQDGDRGGRQARTAREAAALRREQRRVLAIGAGQHPEVKPLQSASRKRKAPDPLQHNPGGPHNLFIMAALPPRERRASRKQAGGTALVHSGLRCCSVDACLGPRP